MAGELSSPFLNYGMREIPGHRDKVYSVAWNSNGRKLASASLDKTILLWSIEPHCHGKPERAERELKGHTSEVADLAWDPRNPDRLASASSDKTVKIWDTRAGRCSSTYSTPGDPLYIRYNPRDAHIIASVCASRGDSTILSFIDTRKGAIMLNVPRNYEVNDVAFSKDGRLFFQTTSTGEIEVYTWPDLTRIHVLEGHTDTSYCITLDPTGRYLASGGEDSMALIWDLTCMACVAAFSGNDHSIRHMSFTHDSLYLAYGGEDQSTIMIEPLFPGGVSYQRQTLARIDSLSWHPSKMVLAFTGSYPATSRHDSRSSGSSSYRGNVGILAPP